LTHPVSIVIPTVNRRDSVLRTVRSALQQSFAASGYEIVVVIDGPDDGTAAAMRSLDAGSRLRVVELEKNRGPAAARNAGWQAATGALVIFLDDDMICTPELVGAHVAFHAGVADDHKLVGMGGVYASPEQQPGMAAETFLKGLGAVYVQHRSHPDEPWPIDVWSFANTSVARAMLERTGGFDERFRKREDAELGVRLLKLGVQQRFVSGAVAFQSSEKSVQELIHDAEVSGDCDLLFMQMHPGSIPHDFITHLRKEGLWKRRARQLLSTNLAFADFMLAPMCSLGEWRVIPRPLRNLAVRALLFRCGLHWYRKVSQTSHTEAGIPE
jgi:glycosyltransferase involved in cell wall biosynthesis